MPEPFLTASEIGEYAFCPQAWYLRRRKVRPSSIAAERLSSGIRAHQEIGRKTDDVSSRRRAQRLLLLVAIGLLVLIVFQSLASASARP